MLSRESKWAPEGIKIFPSFRFFHIREEGFAADDGLLRKVNLCCRVEPGKRIPIDLTGDFSSRKDKAGMLIALKNIQPGEQKQDSSQKIAEELSLLKRLIKKQEQDCHNCIKVDEDPLPAFGCIIPHPPAGGDIDEDNEERKRPVKCVFVFFPKMPESEDRDQGHRGVDKPTTVVTEEDAEKMRMKEMETLLPVLINQPMTGGVMPEDQGKG